MLIDNVILEMIGPDPRIHQIPELFHAEIYGRLHQGQEDSGDAYYYAAIQIAIRPPDAEEVLDGVLSWLVSHAALLQEFRCDKTLEIQSHMLAIDGSRSLCLDPQFIDALSKAGLALRHQVSRERGD